MPTLCVICDKPIAWDATVEIPIEPPGTPATGPIAHATCPADALDLYAGSDLSRICPSCGKPIEPGEAMVGLRYHGRIVFTHPGCPDPNLPGPTVQVDEKATGIPDFDE